MINECGTLCEIRIGRENQSTWIKTPQCHFVYHKSHMTCFRIECEPKLMVINYDKKHGN
jgi:hypothetical protein